MNNFIPIPTPAKIEAPNASPAKRDVGKPNSTKENNFDAELDRAKQQVEPKGNQDNNSSESNTSVDTQTASNHQENNQAQPAAGQQPATQQQATTQNNAQQYSNKTDLLFSTKEGLSEALSNPLATANPQSSKTSNKQDALLSQIQKIINSNDIAPEKVSIRATQQTAAQPQPAQNNLLAQTPVQTSSAPVTQESILASIINGSENVSTQHKATSPVTELGNQRMDNGQNLFSTKMTKQGEANIINNNTSSFQQSQTESNSQGQQFQSPLNNNPSQGLDLLSPFTQTLSGSLGDMTTTTGIVNGQNSIILASGHVVYEDQIIQQIQQQFRLQANKVQQQIKMQLHPAELGELKLDLTMKDGSIRVNVVAQTSQAQELLDRNMPKLKHILEEQGISVEDITVTQASDASRDFNLFDGQFAGTSHFSGQNEPNTNSRSFRDQISEVGDIGIVSSELTPAPTTADTGISVTI